jgi:hypothetical protein
MRCRKDKITATHSGDSLFVIENLLLPGRQCFQSPQFLDPDGPPSKRAEDAEEPSIIEDKVKAEDVIEAVYDDVDDAET